MVHWGAPAQSWGAVKLLGHRRHLPDYSFLLLSQRGFLKDVCFPPSSF